MRQMNANLISEIVSKYLEETKPFQSTDFIESNGGNTTLNSR